MPVLTHEGRGEARTRVLHLVAGNLYGGVETILVTLARYRHLCPKMEPHFGLCCEGRLSRTLGELDAPVHRLGEVRARHPWSVWRARRRLCALLDEHDFDAVFCHASWSHAMFGATVRRHGTPLVFYLHNRVTGRHWLERWAARTPPDLVLSVSRDTAATAANIFPGVPNQVIYSPLPQPGACLAAGERAALRASLDTPPDSTVIVQVSRLEPWKGHTALLEALGRLSDLGNWLCWIVGGVQKPEEARYLEELRQLAAARGIAGRVRFLGERSDVPRLLAAADLFCQPNKDVEGLGIVFVEAFLASLPVITTAMGGAVEVVNESCGILVPPADEKALTRALRRLILDGQERQRMGAAGCRRVHEMCDTRSQLYKLRAFCASLAPGGAAEVVASGVNHAR